MVEKLIHDVVKNEHRLIIPNVGAFLRKRNGENIESSPLTFSPLLRFNDEILERTLVQVEHISETEATEDVKRLSQAITTALAQQQPYYIEQLGSFYQDERGTVQFFFASSESEAMQGINAILSGEKNSSSIAGNEVVPALIPEAPASPALDSISAAAEALERLNKKREAEKQQAAASVSAATVEPQNVDKADEQKAAEEERQRLQAEEEERKQAEDSLRKQAEAEVARRLAEEEERKQREAQAAQKAAEEQAQKAFNPLPSFTSDILDTPITERKKSHHGLWLFYVIGAIVLLAACATLAFWSDISRYLGYVDDTASVVEAPQPTPPPVVAKPAPEPVAPVAVAPKAPQFYHVIAVKVSSRHSAVMFQKRLKQTSEIIRLADGKYAVSLGKFNDMHAATRALNAYKRKFKQATIVRR